MNFMCERACDCERPHGCDSDLLLGIVGQKTEIGVRSVGVSVGGAGRGLVWVKQKKQQLQSGCGPVFHVLHSFSQSSGSGLLFPPEEFLNQFFLNT